MPKRLITDQDVRDPVELRLRMAEVYDNLYTLLGEVRDLQQQVKRAESDSGLTAEDRELLNALAGGSSESSAPVVRPVLPEVDSLPPASSNPTNGELVLLSTDGLVYYYDSEAASWVAVGAASPANMVTTDTVQTISGAKTFSAATTFQADVDVSGGTNATVDLVPANGSTARLRILNAAATVMWSIYSSVTVGGLQTALAIRDAVAGIDRITIAVTTGLLTYAGAITATGLLTLNRIGQALLIKPSAAGTAAGTLMFEIQTDAGVSKASIDIEGDAIFNNITANAAAAITGQANCYGGLYTEGEVSIIDSFRFAPVSASGTPYAIGADGVLFAWSRSSTGTGTITLPSTGLDGRLVIIYDSDENASVNNLTIGVPLGSYLDGVLNGTMVMNTNGERHMFIRTTSNNWISLT